MAIRMYRLLCVPFVILYCEGLLVHCLQTCEHVNAGQSIKCLLLFINMSLKCEHESDGVSTWAKLDGFTHKECPLMCKSAVKEFVAVHM